MRISFLIIFCAFAGTLYAQPAITSFSPSSGTVGTSVTINGSGFDATASQNIIYFGHAWAVPTASTGTTLTVTVPDNASSVNPIRVTNLTSGLSVDSWTAAVPRFHVTFSGGAITSTSFTASNINLATVATQAIAVGDFDSDGDLDIAVGLNAGGSGVGNLQIYFNNGSGSFTLSSQNGNLNISDMLALDVEGDGDLDLILRGDNYLVKINDGSGNFSDGAAIAAANGTRGFNLADINEDGNWDVVMGASSGDAQWGAGNGAGNFTFSQISAAAGGGIAVGSAVGDLNKDGHVDMILPNYNESILVYASNDGAGSFSKANTAATFQPGSVDVGDFNNDNNLDVAIAPLASGTNIRRFLGNGNGTFQTGQNLTATGDPRSIVTGDYNGDGNDDLMVVDYSATGNPRFFLGAGNNSFSTVQITGGTGSGAFTKPIVADFNGDSKPDMVMTERNGQNIRLYMRNSETPTTQATNISFTNVGTAQMDLSWSNGNGSKRIVVVKEGSAVNSLPTNSSTYSANTNFGSGDQLGTGNYVVYNGTQNNVKVTGLNPGTTYHVRVFEYDGVPGGELYFTNSATGNPSSEVTLDAFITTWSTNDGQLTIPTTGGGYNYNIKWTNLTSIGVGDGTISGQTGDYTITGLADGNIYQVEIAGNFPQIYFNNAGDRSKILTIEQWGGNPWTSMESAFAGCTNLTYNAVDNPDLSNVNSLAYMFQNCSSFNGNINGWNVITINNLRNMFQSSGFNQPLNNWDVDNVTNFASLFELNSSFNQDLGGWEVGMALDMSNMFRAASSFNNGGMPMAWGAKTAGVTTMASMFSGASAFNQDITGWNVSSVQNMSFMFSLASSFNQDLSNWEVGMVENMSYMFSQNFTFNNDNQPLTWGTKTGMVTNMGSMFNNSRFNADISDWDVSSVQNMSFMHSGNLDFNQSLGDWDISSVTNMTGMFSFNPMSLANYDATLIGWADDNGGTETIPTGISINVPDFIYCEGEAARTSLDTTYSWTFIGDSKDCSFFYIVTNTNDSGEGSLRWAITNANSSSNETISFNLTGTGPWTITSLTDLPVLTSTTAIDATTQTGWTSTNMIQIVKGGASEYGFEINADACEIYGFDISGFNGSADAGIYIYTGVTTGVIGSANKGNVIAGNENGIQNRGSNITIQGNKLGTNQNGTSANPNKIGIYISTGTGNTVGGSLVGEGNLISGNSNYGVRMLNTTGNIIKGNYIGTDINGVIAIPNEIRGLELGFNVANSASSNIIGGSLAGEGNVIAGNYQANIIIFNGTDNIIQGNKIGVNVNGDILEYASGNPTDYGVWLNGFSTSPVLDNNLIGGFGTGEGNVIAGNNRGVVIDPNLSSGGVANQNTIRGNTIYCNVALGIELMDNANNSIAAPIIASYTTGTGTATVTGSCAACTAGDLIDVYRDNSTCKNGQGDEYLGTVTFSSNPWSLNSLTLSVGDILTAQVTDLNGNSSEFFLAEPEIEIYQGSDNTGTLLTDNVSSIDFGTTAEGTPIDITFAIENTGLGNMNLTLPLTVSSTGFSILTQPSSASVAPFTTETFVVRLDASAIGTFSNRQVRIDSDDTDEGIFTFLVTGNVIDPYIVTNTNDSGIGSLRWAIDNANASSGETIIFNIPGISWIITPSTPLPTISSTTILDATTQTNWSTTNLIVLDGTNTTSANGLDVSADNCEIYGFEITNFNYGINISNLSTGGQIGDVNKGNVIPVVGSRGILLEGSDFVVQGNKIGTDNTGMIAGSTGLGIQITGANNLIGGSATGEENIICRGVNSAGHGISLSGTGNRVYGNLIGTNALGTSALPNERGIQITGSNNFIGGPNPGEGNLISGNSFYGIRIRVGADGNVIQGNLIGTDINGTSALPNGNEGGIRILDAANNTLIGGSNSGEGNVISGNNRNGISINNGSFTIIQGNKIGVDINGDPLGNGAHGIGISAGNSAAVSGVVIGGTGAGESNTISYNNDYGIEIEPNLAGAGSADQISIRYNEFFCNSAGAIDLIDNANSSIASPTINSYTQGTGTGSVTGECTGCTSGDLIDVYRDNETCGGLAQAKEYLGTVTYTSGNWTLGSLTLTNGDRITAINNDIAGNSSELSISEPEISLFLGINNTGTEITNGQVGVIDFGSVVLGTPIDLTFAIENLGLENLNISGVSISTGDYNVLSAPNSPINPYLTTTFVIRLDGSAIGVYDATVTIFSDDSDEGSFTYDVTGEVVDPYIVTNTNDSGIGSLRWAIDNSNSSFGEPISFNIPSSDPNYTSGAREFWTIAPVTDLPDITETIILDGTTQPGSGNFNIVLNGGGTLTNGFLLNNTNAAGSEIYGLYITNFTNGIFTNYNSTSGITIGSPTKGNTIVNCTNGIRSTLARNHTIQSNFIGTDENGNTGLGNDSGISLSTAGPQLIGGSNANQGNVISGNTTGISANASGGLQVIKNYIGTNSSDVTNIGNVTGIKLATSTSNQVLDNIISGNSGSAIELSFSSNNTIQGNYIGVLDDGSTALGNNIGIEFFGSLSSSNNAIGGIGIGEANIIANHTNQAIVLVDSDQVNNSFIGNSIYCNGSGIDLNDVGNNNIQPPVINEVTSSTIGGTGEIGEDIHVYRDNTGCTPSDPQGQEYLGTATVDGSGNWQVTGLTITTGTDLITATASNGTDGTSKFTVQDPFVVTNNLDTGIGSLRWCVDNANNDPEANTITFESSLNGSIIILNSTVAIAFGNGNGTVINGDIDNNNEPDITIQASGTGYSGVTINASNCQIQYLHIQGFSGTVQGAIVIDGSAAIGNHIIGNYLGTNSSATAAGTSNYAGILIDNAATGNFIGDGTATGRNIIGNNTFGVYIRNGSENTTISGNNIGIALDGTTAIGNIGRGIDIFSTNNTKIGIIGELQNVISSSANEGIRLNGSLNTIIVNNMIGVDVSGTLDRGNATGIDITNSSNNTQIGDGTVNGRNIVSGSSGHGISIDDSDGTMIMGNYIGLGSDGSTELANNFGVLVDGTSANTHIGNGSAGGRNIISANTRGVQINNGPTYVYGNFIGTDFNGTADRGNQLAGVQIGGGTGSQVGGSSTGNGNIISGNGWGIGVGVGGNDILGNYIGTNVSGTGALPNNNQGIRLSAGSGTNIGDGTSLGANVISGNTLDGILIENASTTNNTIDFNYIGVQADGTSNLGNSRNGILIESQANGNLLSNNVIAYNADNGVELGEVAVTGIENNTLSQNSMFNNGNEGILITNGAQNGILPPAISSVSPTELTGAGGNDGDIIEVFNNNTSATPQGELFLGQTTVSSGTWSLSGSFPASKNFTATATDASGNTSEFATAVGFDPPGNALDFDGVDDYVIVPNSPSINFGDVDFSVEFWISTTVSSDGRIITKHECAVGPGWFVTNTMTGIVNFYVNGSTLSSTSIVNDGQWHHVAVTFQGSSNTQTIYIDGAFDTSKIGNNGVANTEPLGIGAWANALCGPGTEPIDAEIDEVRIWNTKRSIAEIQTNMYNELVGNEAGLAAYYQFNEGIAGVINTGINVLPDLSSNGNDGTLTNFDLGVADVNHSNWVESSAFVPRTPTDLFVIETSSTSINLNWTDNALNETDYIIERSDGNNSNFVQIDIAAAGTESYVDNSVTLGNGYFYRVIAKNSTDNSEPSNEKFGSTITPPGNALDFNGTSDLVDFGDVTFMDGLSSLTIEAWFNTRVSPFLTASNEQYSIISKGNMSFSGNNTAGIYFLSTDGGGDLIGRIGTDAGTQTASYPSTNINENEWYHVAMSWTSGGNVNLYINGVLVASSSSVLGGTIDEISESLYFGNSDNGFEKKFDGRIDEVRIWDDIRTQGELQANLKSALVGNESNLIAYYRFDQGIPGGDNNTPPINLLPDRSQNSHDGTLSLDPQFSLNGLTSNWVISEILNEPEITVFQGIDNSGVALTNAQVTAVNFGSAIEGNDITLTFAIENIGASTLDISSISATGIDFTVTSAITTVGINDTETFSITLSGTTVGTFNSTISIASDDADENPFTFPVTGTITAPEINLFVGNDNTGTAITDAQTTDIDFGSAVQTNDITQTFAIENTGTSTLNVSSISASGFDFTITSTITTVAAGATENFTITLDGTNTGSFNSTITIASDDADENPFTFPVTGMITAPEINLFVGNDNTGIAITDAQTTEIDFGSAGQTNDITQTFAIENTGTSTLNVSDISASGSDFTITSAITSVTAGATENFTITLAGTNTGTFNSTITIASDDADENPFTFPVTGMITAPEINLFAGNDNTGTVITDAQTTEIDFGSAVQTNDITQTFAIENTGTSTLNVSSISASGSDFTITSTITTVAAGATENFTLTLSGTNTGVFNATITIASDDADENPFTFPVTGTITAPEINLFVGNDNTGTVITDAQTTEIDFGSAVQTNDITQTFAIENTGTSTLNVSSISASGSDFTVTNAIITVAAGATENFTITLAGTNTGIFNTTITIASDDADENPFTFPVTGTITAPEINLFVGNDNTGTTITDAQTTSIDLGSADVGNDLIQTFAIENTGTSPLNVSNISASESDFTITSAITTVAAGATENFIVTLSGANAGTFNSTITIASDDADENPFTFPVTGMITAPEINLFVGNDNTGTAIVDAQTTPIELGTATIGNDITQTFAIENTGTSTLNVSDISASGSDFTITSAITSVAAGETEIFNVTLSGTNAGTFNSIISVISDDADEASFSFTVNGTITSSNQPEINLFVGNNDTGTSIINRQTPSIDFGSAVIGNDIQQNFTISNTGTSTLNINSISVTSTDFSVSSSLSTVAPGTSEVFAITLSGIKAGRFNTTVTITNNDSDEGVFSFPLTGLIEGVNIIDGNNNNGNILISNQEINIGTTDLGKNIEKEFTIQNLSVSNNLIINSIVSDNPVFELKDIPTSVAPESSIQFMVVLVAANPGVYTTNISVSTSINDFAFMVTGEVLEGALPPLIVYNVVTPNGDAVHDIFKIDNITFYPNNNVIIYNRWGDKVFEMEAYDNLGKVFTGTANVGLNEELDTDNYYYSIDKGDGSKKETGFLFIKR